MNVSRLVALCLPALLLSGCFALSPRLDPWDQEATRADGELLAVVPDEHVADMRLRQVVMERNAYLNGASKPDEAGIAMIKAHEVRVGMTREQVVFAMESHPMRIRRQGPPGGDTYLFYPHRYWVRFDGEGRAVGAGRY